MTGRKPLKDFGPVQLATRLDLAEWQFVRVRADALIPAPDSGTRWSAAVVDQLAERAGEIRAAAGAQPDVGAFRAAEILASRFGFDVDGDAVIELAHRGLLPIVGDYKGYPLYCGRVLESFTDREAVLEAVRDGALLTSDASAAHMRIRRSDFDHLVRSGLLTRRMLGRSMYLRRRDGDNVPLYRVADLEAVLSYPDIDWDAVRATPAGARSPLAKLPTAAGPLMTGDSRVADN